MNSKKMSLLKCDGTDNNSTIRKATSYIIVKDEGSYENSYTTYNDFEKEVNEKLKEGWKLCGGVSIGSIGDNHFCICQAMKKEEKR